MRRTRTKALLTCTLVGAMALACATPAGRERGGQVAPLAPEAEAGAAFMKGRMLELNGRLLEAAEAYEEAARTDPDSVELQRQLAQVWGRAGNHERALEHAKRAYELDPDDEDTRRALAALYIATKQYEEAAETLEPSLRSGELSDEGLFGLFNLYRQIEDYEGAEVVASEMIARNPKSLRGYLALGAVLAVTDRSQEAEQAYRQGLEVMPDHPGSYDALARLRRNAGDQEGELEILREKLVVLPGDPGALLRMAQIYDEQGKRETAIETLEALASAQPTHLGAQFQLGVFYYQEDRHADAIVRLTRILREGANQQNFPLVHEVRYFLGLVHYDAGEKDQALESLRLVPSESKRFPDARILMSRIYEEREQYPEALAEAQRAVLAEPENLALQVSLAGFMQRSGNFKDATELMRDLIKTHPENTDLYYDLGLLYAEAEGEDEAQVLEIMHQVLELDPSHANALNYIGYTWAERGVRLDEAERMIRRASEQRPDDGYIADSLGWVLYQRGLQLLAEGQTTDAREALTTAVTHLERSAELLEEGDPIITRHLGDAYRSVSRFPDALAAYRQALTLDPKEADAKEIQRQIELLELQLEGASSGARP